MSDVAENYANLFYVLLRFRSYLILGREKDDSPSGVVTGTVGATQRSIVIEWREEWDQRMRRFRRRARKCK